MKSSRIIIILILLITVTQIFTAVQLVSNYHSLHDVFVRLVEYQEELENRYSPESEPETNGVTIEILPLPEPEQDNGTIIPLPLPAPEHDGGTIVPLPLPEPEHESPRIIPLPNKTEDKNIWLLH